MYRYMYIHTHIGHYMLLSLFVICCSCVVLCCSFVNNSIRCIITHD